MWPLVIKIVIKGKVAGKVCKRKTMLHVGGRHRKMDGRSLYKCTMNTQYRGCWKFSAKKIFSVEIAIDYIFR